MRALIISSASLAAAVLLADASAAPAPIALGPTPASLMAYEDTELVTDELPIDARFGLRVAFTHSNFVSGQRNERWGLDAPDLGWVRLAADVSLGYQLARKLRVSTSISMSKSLKNDYFSGPPEGAQTVRATEIGDLGLHAGGRIGKLPRLEIDASWSVSAQLPTSATSRAGGVVFRLAPSLSLAREVGPIQLGLGGTYTFSRFDNPTQRIICERAPDNCRISGEDLGNPNTPHLFSCRVGVSHTIRKRVTLAVSYGLSFGIGAVEFAEDAETSEYAQTGLQYAGLSQSLALSANWAIFDGTGLQGTVSTGAPFWTADGTSWRVPFVGLEGQLLTIYSVSLSQSF